LHRQGDDVLGQRLFVVRPARHLAMCRSMLAQNPTDPPLGYGKLGANMIDTPPPPRGA